LNGVFGIVFQALGEKADWADFQSECATTWGSFGYLLSALCQWYEAVNKHPIEEAVRAILFLSLSVWANDISQYFDDSGHMHNFQVHDVADMHDLPLGQKIEE